MSSEDKRIIEQTASTTVPDDAFFIFDSALLGTFKISKALMKELLGGGKVIELTKAQYDALPDTKLSDDIIYAIKDQETSYVVDIQVDGNSILDEDGIADLSVISKIEDEIANSIAEEYDSTQTYTYNSWVFHEGTLYRCISQSTTGTWDATKWQAKTIKEFIDTAKNSVLGTIEQMFGEYLPISTLDPPSIEAISKGDIFIYQRTNRYKFYRAKADHPQGVTEFNIDDWDEFDTVADLIEDVTEKIDEIEIPVKDVQVKTDSTYDSVVDASGNAKIDLSSVTAYGEVPNLPQAIATFKDGADTPMKSLKVAIEPQQDLHGYDAPWVGGAGKNKLSLTVDRIKSDNTSGSWSGNTYSINGAEYKINTDNAGNVISISARNLASNPNGDLRLVFTLSSGSYILSSGFTETNGTNDSYLQKNKVTIARGNNSSPGPNFTLDSSSEVVYHLRLSKSGDSSYIAYPMIRLASVADATFEPYSNICPIIGHTEANVTRTGKNLANLTYGNKVPSVTTGEMVPTYGWSSDFFKLDKTKSYIVSTTVASRYILFYGANKNYLGYIITYANGYVLNSNQYWDDAVYIKHRSDTTSDTTPDIQLEVGTTATSYEAYNGHTYTIDLGETRYGGELDVTSGELTVDRVNVTITGAETTWRTLGTGFAVRINEIGVFNINKGKAICSHFKKNDSYNWSVLGNGEFNLADKYCAFKNDLYFTTVAEAQTYFANLYNNNTPCTVCGVLETPTTIQLTPTQVKSLLGQNNIWADTGDINECVYRRDMSSTIDDILARLEALEG